MNKQSFEGYLGSHLLRSSSQNEQMYLEVNPAMCQIASECPTIGRKTIRYAEIIRLVDDAEFPHPTSHQPRPRPRRRTTIAFLVVSHLEEEWMVCFQPRTVQ